MTSPTNAMRHIGARRVLSFIAANKLSLRERIFLRRNLYGGAGSLRLERQVRNAQRHEPKPVAVRAVTRGRAGPVISAFVKIVLRLFWTVGIVLPCQMLGQASPVGRDVEDRPMMPRAARRVGILANQREAARC